MCQPRPAFRRAVRALSLLLMLTACGGEPPAVAVGARAPLPLPTATVAAVPLPAGWSAVGTLVSDQRIELSSRISGYIRALHVREGETVTAGQLLVSLDGAEVEGAIQQAQSAVDTAVSQVADADADLTRYQNLFDAGSVAEVQLRKVRLQRDTLAEQLQSARAALAAATAERDYSRILSPHAGVVVACHRRGGDLALPGQPILTLESPQQLMFDTYVTDAQLARLHLGAPVAVTVDGAEISGSVARIVPSSDPVTHKFQVKVALPAQVGLRAGGFGRARFAGGETRQPVVHPDWLVERGGLRGVFVVDAERRAHFRWLRTRREWPDQIEVVSGLRAGETVVAVDDPRLRDGDVIAPAPTAVPAPAP